MANEVSPLSMDCISCNESAVLQSAEAEDKWPRELSYLCPNGHRIQVMQISDPRTMPPTPPTNPSLPRMHKFIHPSLKAELSLFHVSNNLRRKLGKKYDRANSHLNELEAYINAAILQFHRFLLLGQFQYQNWTSLSLKQEPNEEEHLQAFFTILQIRFTELHFFLIATDKVDKHLKRFKKAVEQIARDSNLVEEKKWRQTVKSRFAKAFEGHKRARDYLEHKDEKIRSGGLPALTFSEESGIIKFSYVDVDGTQNAIIDIDRLIEAYNSFVDWVYTFPDLV